MLLSKVQQNDCYTQLCNYREEFVSKPISNQLNILVGCNLSFKRSLNETYNSYFGVTLKNNRLMFVSVNV